MALLKSIYQADRTKKKPVIQIRHTLFIFKSVLENPAFVWRQLCCI